MKRSRTGTPGWMFAAVVATFVVWCAVAYVFGEHGWTPEVKVAALLLWMLVFLISQNALGLSLTVRDLQRTVARLERELEALSQTASRSRD